MNDTSKKTELAFIQWHYIDPKRSHSTESTFNPTIFILGCPAGQTKKKGGVSGHQRKYLDAIALLRLGDP